MSDAARGPMAAWDVHQAKVFDRCEAKTGIATTDRLVEQVMTQEPYRSARRVFWVMDNGSGYRGKRAAKRLKMQWPNAGKHSGSRQLAQPDRDLSRYRPTKGSYS
jgi:hypothetical protein